MAEEKETKEREDAARRDAEEKGRWDKMFSAMDAICSRMDAFEEKEKERADRARKDAEEAEAKAKADAEEEEKAKADAAKKDAEEAEAKAKADAEDKEKEEEKTKADALARADAAIAALGTRVDAVVSHLAGEPSEDLGAAQARADAVYLAHGKQAPAPMVAEKAIDYRRRLLRGVQASAPAWKDADFNTVPPGSIFDKLEAQVYADAAAAARDPSTAVPGQLRKITRKTEAGHTINEYVGDWRDGNRGLVQPLPRVGKLQRSA